MAKADEAAAAAAAAAGVVATSGARRRSRNKRDSEEMAPPVPLLELAGGGLSLPALVNADGTSISRPGSRAASISIAGSRPGSSRPGSRSGSLAKGALLS
jgi:hypothetical protein